MGTATGYAGAINQAFHQLEISLLYNSMKDAQTQTNKTFRFRPK